METKQGKKARGEERVLCNICTRKTFPGLLTWDLRETVISFCKHHGVKLKFQGFRGPQYSQAQAMVYAPGEKEDIGLGAHILV